MQRDSDSDGLEDWVGQLLRHEAGAGEISKGFFFSWEFQWRYPGKEAFVDICYRTYLNREPDPNGKKAWVELLRRGQSLEQILDGFIGSQEFGNLCAAYGIERSTMCEIKIVSLRAGGECRSTPPFFCTQKYCRNSCFLGLH